MDTLQLTLFTYSFHPNKSDAVSEVGFFLGISFCFNAIETNSPL